MPTPTDPPKGGLAWAGLGIPGLGHLLTGQVMDGIGHLSLTSLVIWAGAAGLPRLGTLLHGPSSAEFQLHP